MEEQVMVNPGIVAVVLIGSGMLMLPLTLTVFKVHYTMLDIGLAAVCAGLLTLVPVIGQALSLLAMAAILDRRLSARLAPDILVAVAVARLCAVPVLLLIELHQHPPA
jgi:hypothetical protein